MAKRSKFGGPVSNEQALAPYSLAINATAWMVLELWTRKIWHVTVAKCKVKVEVKLSE